MRKLLAMALVSVVAFGAAGPVQAHCGPGHACEGAYCTR